MWPTQRLAYKLYGIPDANGDGIPDPKWEADNLVLIDPPYRMYWSWNNMPVRKLRVHKICADSMLQALTRIGREFSETDRETYHLDQCGGAYNFRPMRGGTALSMHSYGCAIDLAPLLNPLGKRWNPKLNMMPMKAVEAFRALGATWGGDWDGDKDTLDQRRHDAMHFQFAGL